MESNDVGLCIKETHDIPCSSIWSWTRCQEDHVLAVQVVTAEDYCIAVCKTGRRKHETVTTTTPTKVDTAFHHIEAFLDYELELIGLPDQHNILHLFYDIFYIIQLVVVLARAASTSLKSTTSTCPHETSNIAGISSLSFDIGHAPGPSTSNSQILTPEHRTRQVDLHPTTQRSNVNVLHQSFVSAYKPLELVLQLDLHIYVVHLLQLLDVSRETYDFLCIERLSGLCRNSSFAPVAPTIGALFSASKFNTSVVR